MGRSSATNLDVAMAGQWTLSALGPIDHGGKERVQTVLRGLGTSGAQGRIGLIPNIRSRQWAFDPTFLDAAVVELEPVGEAEVADTMRALAASPPSRAPIWVALAGDWIFIYLDHGVGDGFMTIGLSAALFGAPGEPAPWQRAPKVRHPLATALFGALTTNPRLPLDTALKLGRKPASSVSDDEVRSWTPSFDVAFARGKPESFISLMEWRDANAPGVSLVALQSALRVRALREVGLEPRPTIKLLVDGRRYLPKGSLVTSNFAAGVDLVIDDPANPNQVAESFKHVTGSGSAAVTLAATTGMIQLDRLRSRVPQTATEIPVTPRPNIAITDLGRPPALEQLPWKTDHSVPPTYIGLVSPADPQAITFAGGRLLGRVQEIASFHNNVFARDAIQHVVNAVAHESIRLLDSMNVG